MHVAFLGFGLMSGSVALALRASPDPAWSRSRLVAWSPTGRGPARAVVDGVLDQAAGSPRDAIAGADLVILGAPSHLAVAQVDELAGPLRDALAREALVTDVASTKAQLVAAAERGGVRFVGGHPMAGREQPGYGAATADLYVDRPWLIVAPASAGEDDILRVDALARACGARPVRMDPLTHDRAVAAVSHLPLIVSAALVEAVAGSGDEGERPGWDVAAGLAAGGWASMTRLARGDALMGAGILATNAAALAGHLRSYRDQLDAWLAELEREGGADVDRPRPASRPRAPAWSAEHGEVSDDELVLVVPREAVIPAASWQGLRDGDLDVILAIVARDGRHRRRGDMERDPAWKQVIPYLVLRDGARYFLMRRTRAGGDRRLHDRYSIGVGGHLNPEDGGVIAGLAREWAEEIDAQFVPEFRFIGLLNDDETDVGRVHLGLVFEGDAAGRPASIRETDKLEGRFADAAEVALVADSLESWSRLAFDHLEGRSPG